MNLETEIKEEVLKAGFENTDMNVKMYKAISIAIERYTEDYVRNYINNNTQVQVIGGGSYPGGIFPTESK